jgi:hypothetical protein
MLHSPFVPRVWLGGLCPPRLLRKRRRWGADGLHGQLASSGASVAGLRCRSGRGAEDLRARRFACHLSCSGPVAVLLIWIVVRNRMAV